jgi:hypothetical protein
VKNIIERLPCITAEMQAIFGRLRRSSVVYLKDPGRDIEDDEVECYGFDHASNPASEYVPWGCLRHIKILFVLTVIGKNCKRMTEEEMVAMVERIRGEHVPLIDDFGTGLDDLV